MGARLDHITVIAPTLEVGSAFVETALGFAPGPGREHPAMGTHNRLLALGPAIYLEVISSDPTVGQIARPRWFGLDQMEAGSGARLAAWVASTEDIAAADAPGLGPVETMWRGSHSWQMTVREDGRVPMEGAAPLLIQRSPDARPMTGIVDRGLRLHRLRVQHPAPSLVADLLRRIGLDSTYAVVVSHGSSCRLAADIETPLGPRTLGDA